MSQFTNYSDIIFDAFCLNSKRAEIVERKLEIIEKIFEFYNTAAGSVLFVGFNPAILSIDAREIFVTEVSDRVLTWLREQDSRIQPLTLTVPRKFDVVIAFDEYLTFANDEAEQYAKIDNICKFSSGLIVTTVKDYKNQEFKDREYSQPAIIRTGNIWAAYTEIHDWSTKDKNSFNTMVYQLTMDSSKYQDCLLYTSDAADE